MTEQSFIATAPAGMEPLLAAELIELGAATPRPMRGGVAFQGSLELAYRACLWSRTASRVLLPLAEFPAADAEALYASIRDLPWEEHLAPDGTLSIEFSGGGPGIDHTHYGAQRVKDAIVDRFRARCGQRPSVARASRICEFTRAGAMVRPRSASTCPATACTAAATARSP